MNSEESSTIAVEHGTAYGRVFRERGTLRILLAALLLWGAWYAYDSVQTRLMFQKQWPALQPSMKGLTVLGLLDRERNGVKPRYVAIESNHSWQIRYREDAEPDDQGDSPEARDRGANPAASHRTNRGAVVPMQELFEKLPVAMSGNHFVSARIEQRSEPLFDRKYWVVHVGLSPEGRSRYWQFSKEHDDERLVFILNGEVSTCPRMKHMDASDLTIEQFWIKADAEKLANFINNQKS